MMNLSTPISLLHPHPIEREGMAGYLEMLNGFCVVQKAAGPEAFLESSHSEDIHLVLAFFYELPERADWILRLKERIPHAVFMISTPEVFAERLSDYLSVGVNGYVCSDVDTEEFERALRTVASGKQYYSHKVMVALAKASGVRQHADPYAVRKSLLSGREIQILKLVANEYSSAKIANELCISDKTVETHRRNLFQKLGVKNAIGLTKAAVRLGLV